MDIRPYVEPPICSLKRPDIENGYAVKTCTVNL